MEGYLLVGENGNTETIAALRCFFKERIFTGEVYINGDGSMSLAAHPPAWVEKLPVLISM